MHKILLTLLLSITTAFLSAHADDISDAKAAFQTLHEYQKTDDPRSPELFAADCSVKFIFTDGLRTKEVAFTPEQFRKWLEKAMSLKQGNRDEYKDIRVEKSDAGIKLNCMILQATNGNLEPLSILYVRDADGTLKIKEMVTTISVAAKTP